MCVGTKDGYSGRKYLSSEDLATWPSASEDKLDIVGEAIMDESADEIIWIYLRPPYCTIPL
jgi:hypothetical protein